MELRLATITGYCSLLDLYAKCSVQSQHARTFPTTTMSAVFELESTLEQLGKGWTWSEEEMVLAGFGAPRAIIDGLLSGIYQPKVKKWTATRTQIHHSIFRVEHNRQEHNLMSTGITDEEMEEVLNWRPMAAENESSERVSSGQIPVEDFNESKKMKVEEHLSSLASSLHQRLSNRLMILPHHSQCF